MKVAVKEGKKNHFVPFWTFFRVYLFPWLQSFKVVRSSQRTCVQIPALSLSACNSELNVPLGALKSSINTGLCSCYKVYIK